MTRRRGSRRRDGERGFTLIELLVVITIISILAAVVSTSVGGFITQANEQTRRAQFAAVQTAVDSFVSAHLDASGDLSQATYPFAPGNGGGVNGCCPHSDATALSDSTPTGEPSRAGWYGADGRDCGTGNTCSATPAAGIYIYVDLYSGTATEISSMLRANGGVKAFGKPGYTLPEGVNGLRCLFKSGTSGGNGPAATGSTQAETIATGKTNVRANKGALYVCRDADPKTAGS